MTQTARGNSTRQANKALRKQKILDEARELITSQGYEAFTLSELAQRAGVSIPTIHNLFGKKQEVVEALCGEMVANVNEAVSDPDLTDPIEAVGVYIENLLGLYRSDEAFYRAAFVAGERTGLFEHQLPTGIFNRSLKIARQICMNGVDHGYLKGDIDTHWLAEQLFGCQRLARQDWVNGYIDLDRYRVQVLIGMYMTFAADARPAFYKRLRTGINQLASG
ncbi:TetR/AcrR family transcriptional regulator [Halioglobus maricola]|uniref:TetR/AcrR family transcriptional regulator n=1 Tax=Halioglobus maricola TaxID=2601894 RepID=A0A5P9NF46_9GAMM|nr:TetR/AcrR family transcriptional regulator [Halioglobus maricola]QFU74397.1 TetR/AcrR family transcriptional regulator [Halioglobus maricola]